MYWLVLRFDTPLHFVSNISKPTHELLLCFQLVPAGCRQLLEAGAFFAQPGKGCRQLRNSFHKMVSILLLS
jgi:hypothetical protein